MITVARHGRMIQEIVMRLEMREKYVMMVFDFRMEDGRGSIQRDTGVIEIIWHKYMDVNKSP